MLLSVTLILKYAFFIHCFLPGYFVKIQNPLQTSKFCVFLSVTLILKHVCLFSFIVIFQMIFIIQNPLQTSYMFKFCPFR